jgi:hypothetical protein
MAHGLLCLFLHLSIFYAIALHLHTGERLKNLRWLNRSVMQFQNREIEERIWALHNCGMILEFASKIITASPRLAVWASASFIPLFSNPR